MEAVSPGTNSFAPGPPLAAYKTTTPRKRLPGIGLILTNIFMPQVWVTLDKSLHQIDTFLAIHNFEFHSTGPQIIFRPLKITVSPITILGIP